MIKKNKKNATYSTFKYIYIYIYTVIVTIYILNYNFYNMGYNRVTLQKLMV